MSYDLRKHNDIFSPVFPMVFGAVAGMLFSKGEIFWGFSAFVIGGIVYYGLFRFMKFVWPRLILDSSKRKS